jgi:hypothetical protein
MKVDKRVELPNLEANEASWQRVRLYQMRFDSNIRSEPLRLIWDIDLPIDAWLNEETQEYNFKVCQTRLEFTNIHGFATTMDNGPFDPCELVIDRAQIGHGSEHRDAKGLISWVFNGDWFEISIAARSLKATAYRSAVASDRPWVDPDRRLGANLSA